METDARAERRGPIAGVASFPCSTRSRSNGSSGRRVCPPTTAATKTSQRTDRPAATRHRSAAPAISPAFLTASESYPHAQTTFVPSRPSSRPAGCRHRLLGRRHRAHQTGSRRRRTTDLVADAAHGQLPPPVHHHPGPWPTARVEGADAPAGRAGRAEPRTRVRPWPAWLGIHHGQHVGAVVGSRTGPHRVVRGLPAARTLPRPAPGRPRGRRHRRAAGRLPTRHRGRRPGHTPHPGCCRLLCPLHGRHPAPAARRRVPARRTGEQLAALAFAVVLATTVQLAGGPGWSLGGHGLGIWAAAGASGCLYYGLAFWFYLAGLRQVRASVAGAFLPLIPVFGVAAGYLAGERLEGRQWIGALVVVAATGVMAYWQAHIQVVPTLSSDQHGSQAG